MTKVTGVSPQEHKMAETSKIRTGALTEEEIEKLKATEWGLRVKKYGEDRIYFGAEQLGLKIKGNICSGDMYAELNGKIIPNVDAIILHKSVLYFINVDTGERDYYDYHNLYDDQYGFLENWEDYTKIFTANFNRIVDDARRG